MIQRYEFNQNKQLDDEVLKSYYLQLGKGSSPVKLDGGSVVFNKTRRKKHNLQHGAGIFDVFAKPLYNVLVPSIVKGVASGVISKVSGNSLKDSLKKGVSATVEDALIRKGKSLLTNALTAK
jgi:hypothetical protein